MRDERFRVSCFVSSHGRYRVVPFGMTRPSDSALNVGASCFAGAAVIGLTNPLDCLKQRWQVARTALPSFAFVKEIVATEGLFRGLWRPGLVTNCLACTISVGTRIGLYPSLRDKLTVMTSEPTRTSMFISGLAGGALGYIVAAPLFFATRVAHAEAGLVVDGMLVTGAAAGRAPTAADTGGLGMLRHLWVTTAQPFGLWTGAGMLVARGALMSSTQLATYDSTKRSLQAAGRRFAPSLWFNLADILLTSG